MLAVSRILVSKINTKPSPWIGVKKYVITFSSSYLAERGFNAEAYLLPKKRKRLHSVERFAVDVNDLKRDFNKFFKLRQINYLINFSLIG